MWATIAEGKPSPHKEILINTTPNNGAIRMGNWKLVINGNRTEKGAPKGKATTDGESVELFDLSKDISEKTNLAGQMPDKVKELRSRYEELAKQAVKPKSAPKAMDFVTPKVWGEKD